MPGRRIDKIRFIEMQYLMSKINDNDIKKTGLKVSAAFSQLVSV